MYVMLHKSYKLSLFLIKYLLEVVSITCSHEPLIWQCRSLFMYQLKLLLVHGDNMRTDLEFSCVKMALYYLENKYSDNENWP